ncbi:hypothetical protein SCHPADRAFT_808112, partial [Schizopora paradoxa]
LTTSHHPQADGQTEILNQTIEIAIRAYVGPARDDWAEMIGPIQLAYNSSINASTKFTPAYLLRGFEPQGALNVDREIEGEIRRPGEFESQKAEEWVDAFEACRRQATDALALAQAFQRKHYNKGRLDVEFEEGEHVLINPHSLELLRSFQGKGRKLLMRYDGPFEILQKVSPLAYRLRMPASYGINPVINIAHLERYHKDE